MGLEKAASGVRTSDGMLLRLGPFFFRHVHFPAVCNSILLFSLVALHEFSLLV